MYFLLLNCNLNTHKIIILRHILKEKKKGFSSYYSDAKIHLSLFLFTLRPVMLYCQTLWIDQSLLKIRFLHQHIIAKNLDPDPPCLILTLSHYLQFHSLWTDQYVWSILYVFWTSLQNIFNIKRLHKGSKLRTEKNNHSHCKTIKEFIKLQHLIEIITEKIRKKLMQ